LVYASLGFAVWREYGAAQSGVMVKTWTSPQFNVIKATHLSKGKPRAMPDLSTITAAVSGTSAKGLPPVHLWNPPFCGDIGLRIAVDGTWFYQNSPIGRPAMVRLFASILRKDADRHVLVTPVEMVLVEVEDAPFLAVELVTGPGQTLTFRTNVDDWTTASEEKPLRFEPEATGGLRPYVLVRGGLWARLTRSVALELLERAETRTIHGQDKIGVASGTAFFPMMPADVMPTDGVK
jgi:uncharacterized protein